jgi:hypothetical protein
VFIFIDTWVSKGSGEEGQMCVQSGQEVHSTVVSYEITGFITCVHFKCYICG